MGSIMELQNISGSKERDNTMQTINEYEQQGYVNGMDDR